VNRIGFVYSLTLDRAFLRRSSRRHREANGNPRMAQLFWSDPSLARRYIAPYEFMKATVVEIALEEFMTEGIDSLEEANCLAGCEISSTMPD
jgi:hypothetical protein